MAVSPETLPPDVDASWESRSRRRQDRSRPRLRDNRALPQSARSDSRAANDRVCRRRGRAEERGLPGGRARDGFNIGENRRRKLGCHHPGRRVPDNASDARESVPRCSANR